MSQIEKITGPLILEIDKFENELIEKDIIDLDKEFSRLINRLRKTLDKVVEENK